MNNKRGNRKLRTPVAFLRQHPGLETLSEELREAESAVAAKIRDLQNEAKKVQANHNATTHKDLWKRVETYARERDMLPPDYDGEKQYLSLSRKDGVLYVINEKDDDRAGSHSGEDCDCVACALAKAIGLKR